MNLNKLILCFTILILTSNIAFSQIETTSAIRLTGDIYFNSTTNDYYVLDELVNKAFSGKILPNSNQIQGEYDIQLDKPYASNLSNLTMYGARHISSQLMGTSGALINSHLNLEYSTYDNYYGFHNKDGGIIMCNEFGGCSPLRPTSKWVTNQYTHQISSGFKISVNSYFNPTTNDYYVLDELVNKAFSGKILPVSSNKDGGSFNQALDKPYATNLSNLTMYGARHTTVEIMGDSGSLLNNFFSINYLNNHYALHNKQGGVILCNHFGGCSTLRPTSYFSGNEFGSQINNGFWLSTNTNLQILTSTNPLYVNPTPQKNLKTTNLSSIIIRISDNGNTLESCQVIINEQPFEMPYQDNHCEYTYNITQTNNINEITFQGLYNITGTQYKLEKRTVTLYPPNNTNKFPSISIVSILIVGIMMLFL